jgi:serine/threonine-protein kinase
MLSELLARRGPLAPTLAVDIAIRVAYSLAAANRTSAQGMLTPGAIQLTIEGRVLVHPMSAADDEAGTRTPYTPPEMIRGDAPGPASDVFAVGVVLVEMLTGRTRPSKATVAALPADLVSILDCALARDPVDRYPDTRSFARILDAWRRSRFDVATANAYPVRAHSPISVGARRGAETAADPGPGTAGPAPSDPPALAHPGRMRRNAPARDPDGAARSRTAVDPSERYPVTPPERLEPAPRGRRRPGRRSVVVDPSERYPVEEEARQDQHPGAAASRDRRRRRAVVALVGIVAAMILLAFLVLDAPPARSGSAAAVADRGRSHGPPATLHAAILR